MPAHRGTGTHGRQVGGRRHAWPDLSHEGLAENLDEWLGPYLGPVSLLQDFGKLDLGSILEARLSWDQKQRLEQLAPPRFDVPSGSSIKIDYSTSPPVLVQLWSRTLPDGRGVPGQ